MSNITRGVSERTRSLIELHLGALEEALREVQPDHLINRIDFREISGRPTVVLSIGKQAEIFYDAFSVVYTPRIVKAFVVEPSREGEYYKEESSGLTIYHTSHPIASRDSFTATQEILDEMDSLFVEDSNYNLIVLITGGASAAFALAEPGISEDKYISIMTDAMNCGFPIDQLNMIRGFFDSVKVGKLAARYPHVDIYTYIISDVVDDDPRVIGSGPTVPGLKLDKEIKQWLREAMKRYEITLPYEHLHEIMKIASTTDREGKQVTKIIGTRRDLLAALEEGLRSRNISVEIVGTDLQEDVFKEFAAMVERIELRRGDYPLGYQHTMVFSGEPTIELSPNIKGKGGRVSTLAALMSEFISDRQGICFIGLATDGKDGSSPHPCYVVTDQTSKHLRPLGGERKLIQFENTGGALSKLGYGIDLIETNINLMDVYLVLLM